MLHGASELDNLERPDVYLLFCMGVKLGISHWGCFRTRCWGEYLDL